MFKFDFDIDDIDEELDQSISKPPQQSKHEEDGHPQAPFLQHEIQEFLDALPPLISYSPISVPIPNSNKVVQLVRRDLFDARFQLISEGSLESNEEEGLNTITEADEEREEEEEKPQKSKNIDPEILSYLDAPSDLLPGVYEGGLKTWECSLDLVEYLESNEHFPGYTGKRVIELGCGTAVPSLYVLGRVLSESPSSQETHIHLQDYNASVLELVTFPNVILAWYLSPASSSFRELAGKEAIAIDSTTAGELPMTKELKSAFLASLKERNIHLRFFSGSWETFDLSESGGSYDVILTSETIYRQESLPSLIQLLDEGSPSSLDTLVSKQLSLEVKDQTKGEADFLCLVAAKVLYFGVGGGISDFVDMVSKWQPRPGQVETVLEKTTGVGRRVLRLKWT